MNGINRSIRFGSSNALSLCICSALLAGAFHGGTAWASTLTVSTCNDAGIGSLRDAIAQAADGDVIDATSLACSQISLTSGALLIAQGSLEIDGNDLIVDGTYHDRVFQHTGTGTLQLDTIIAQHGKYDSDSTPFGGCIISHGTLVLVDSEVRGCTVVGTGDGSAHGGGIFVDGNLALVTSRVTGNKAQGNGTPLMASVGGGAFVRGSMTAKYSTFDGNQALPSAGHHSAAGAFSALQSTTLVGSTLSNNYALYFGAASFVGQSSSDAVSIANSTIANNKARNVSGLYSQIPMVIANSTIAFNLAVSGGGAVYSKNPIELQSTIIAGNETSHGGPDDLKGTPTTIVTGGNNLITSTTIDVPADTLTTCPRLATLRWNGGAVETMAIAWNSMALEAGNNEANLEIDGRGYPRVLGDAADIGAFEFDFLDLDPDFAFHSGFEPTCDG